MKLLMENWRKFVNEARDRQSLLQAAIIEWFEHEVKEDWMGADEIDRILSAIEANAFEETDIYLGYYGSPGLKSLFGEEFSSEEMAKVFERTHDKGHLNKWGGRGLELVRPDPEDPDDYPEDDPWDFEDEDEPPRPHLELV